MPDINYSSLSGGQQSSYPAGTTAQRPASPTSGQIFYDTDIASLIIWNGSAWGMLNSAPVPAAPVIGTATDVGTARSWNDGSATLTFSPGGAWGTVADEYRATASPGGATSAWQSSSPFTFTGLTTNQAYTFSVVGKNELGTSSSSASSNSITITTVPDTPTINSVADTAAGGTVTINFSAPNNGGKTITNYKYSTDGTNYIEFSPAQTTSPLTVTGLTSFQSYNFRIKAVNANGDSAASSQSASVTPTSSFTISQTFNTSGTYTVPAGVGELALYVIGAGSSGAFSGGAGANTSGAAAGFAVVSSGQNYSVTIGAANQGVSSFGTLLNSQGNGNANGKISSTTGGGNGGSGGSGNSSPGQPGQAGGNLVLSAGGLTTIQYGGGGGGGGHHWQARGGGGGGAPYGGGGGTGEGWEYDGWNRENYQVSGTPGAAGQAGGGGGGGRGAGGSASNGSGGPGKVIIYGRPR